MNEDKYSSNNNKKNNFTTKYTSTNSQNSLNDNDKNSRASPSLKEKYNNMLSALKINNKKAINICVLVIILCVMLVLYFNITTLDKPKNNDAKFDYTYTSSLEYARSLERKVEELLSKIKGAKDAKVMVRLEGSLELILAEKIDEKNNSTTNGSSTNSYITTVTEPIILTSGNISTPLVLTEKLPEVKGVVVVCKGAHDVMVKMDIINAVRILFGIPNGSIEVFAGD